MDRKIQLVVCPVIDLFLTKRHVTDSQIEKVTPIGGFKSSYGNVCVRVQLFCNATCDAVQLYAVQPTALHSIRQHTKEVAHTHARFQNVSVAESHFLDCIIDGADNGGAGIVGIQSAGTSGCILVLGEQSFQFGILFCPVVLVRVKGIRQTTPSNILRKHFLLLGGGSTVFLLQLEQGADSCNVPGVFLFCTALAQMIVRNAEISSSFRHRFGIHGFVCGGCIRECLPFAVDLYRNRQLVQ